MYPLPGRVSLFLPKTQYLHRGNSLFKSFPCLLLLLIILTFSLLILIWLYYNRGRYDIEMFASFMKLHGKTFDYKIEYNTISRLFQLPKPDQRHVFFIVSIRIISTLYFTLSIIYRTPVLILLQFHFSIIWNHQVSLDPPIKQGQTRYPHLVFQFPKEDTSEVTLNLTE